MKNTKKKSTTKKTPIKRKRPNQMNETELRRKYSTWMKNFSFGLSELIELPKNTQMYLWGCVLQQSLFNQTTNPFWNEMYKNDLYPDETDMEDVKLSPLNKKRLENSMEELITTGCRRKFVGVLNSIDKSFHTGEY